MKNTVIDKRNFMGFRFHKRIKLVPGVTLNLSRKGISTSIGTTGAKVTLGHGQTRVTTGLPGSGISHTTITENKSKNSNDVSTEQQSLYISANSLRPVGISKIIGSFIKGLLSMGKHRR
jgi:Protein of unknown function (DUF4236)